MNQILKPEINKESQIIDISNNNPSFLKQASKDKTKSNKIYKFQFILSSCIALCFLLAFFVRMFKLNENEKISKQLMGNYQISTLYSNNMEYSVELVNKNNHSNPFVIGMIKIDKISLNYPILSQSNKELLDISLCRFAGPMPNEIRKSLYRRS